MLDILSERHGSSLSRTACVMLLLSIVARSAWAGQTEIPGPVGSTSFGSAVTVLPNGNVVVRDPDFSIPAGAANVGAVYLYSPTGVLLSTLTGSTASDQIGNFGVTVLANGNFVVRSPNWDNGGIVDAGAATWCSGTTGLSGTVSSANSLVGGTANDQISTFGVIALSNGNYVVNSVNWDNGGVVDAGAVTWGNGSTGISGAVSPLNSLVGNTLNDRIGGAGVTAVGDGNYVVRNPNWDRLLVTDAGALTWADGTTGIVGIVSSANSLIGAQAGDQVGNGGVTVLSNGNYVARIPSWDNGAVDNAGAATWGNGATGITGEISIANSLVGSQANDQVSSSLTALTNGNYAVRSPDWDNGGIADVGAVTLGNGATGRVGVVSLANSLIGGTLNDRVGSSLTALTNGNYIVRSTAWDNGAIADAGAVTWGNGITGITGTVTIANSLVGSTANDQIGSSGTALTNGNYIVRSPNWDNGGIVNAGAVTWGNGTTGIIGTVSPANSLVGFTASDQVGIGATALTNGNYVVRSQNWDNGGIVDAGAATWGNGTTGITGAVSPANSLVGSTASDQVGASGVEDLSNGNYVVNSANWDNGAIANAGAATWGNGATGITGTISPANSLVGSVANDQVGSSGTTSLSNGNYVVGSSNWDNGAIVDAGAATWANGTTGITGTISPANSLVGGTASDQIGDQGVQDVENGNYLVFSIVWDNGALVDSGAITFGHGGGTIGALTANNSVRGTSAGNGSLLSFAYDIDRLQLMVGRPGDNIVTLFNGNTAPTILSGPTATPATAGVGQTVLFGLAASDVDGQALSFSWEAAGTVLTGPAPSFAFTTAGVYTVTVTVSDVIGATASGSVEVTVNAPLVGSGNDSDGDGFSDGVETAAGTDPNNPADSPTGGGLPGVSELAQSKLKIALNFAKAGKDSISFSGTLPVQAGFDPANQKVVIDVGGAIQALTLDAKGRSPKGNTSFKPSIRRKKGVVAAQTAKFRVELSKGAFASALADEGLTDTTVKGANTSVIVRLVFGGIIRQSTQAVVYKAKAGKKGQATALR